MGVSYSTPLFPMSNTMNYTEYTGSLITQLHLITKTFLIFVNITLTLHSVDKKSGVIIKWAHFIKLNRSKRNIVPFRH